MAKMRDMNVWNVPVMSGGKVALYKLVNQNHNFRHNLEHNDIFKGPAGLPPPCPPHGIRRASISITGGYGYECMM